jgi:hypothetical protein
MKLHHADEFFPDQLMKRCGVISDLFWTVHSPRREGMETGVTLDRFECKQIIKALIEARGGDKE